MFFFKNNNKKEKKEVDLIAMTAHQLRRPLSSMKLSLEMLLKGDFGSLQSDQKNIIEKILAQDAILLCLVGDLVDMARTQEGNMNVHNAEPIDVIHLIDSALSLNYQEITRKKIQVEFDRAVHIPNIRLHKDTFMMGVQNIIDNAVKYTAEGGWIKISAAFDGKHVKIKVQDSGIGIPNNDHRNIFKRFFRAGNAMKVTAGSGLGLFIARKAVQASGGKIWFDSEEGAGSTFYIALPIVK